ncbi:MAG: GDCCVxC domain-containing (seleno)protein [Acetobacteraceae bacterium]
MHRAASGVDRAAPHRSCDSVFCGAVLRARKRDCCVFCSFGSVPCPPVQTARLAGSSGAHCAS